MSGRCRQRSRADISVFRDGALLFSGSFFGFWNFMDQIRSDLNRWASGEERILSAPIGVNPFGPQQYEELELPELLEGDQVVVASFHLFRIERMPSGKRLAAYVSNNAVSFLIVLGYDGRTRLLVRERP